MFHSTYVNLKQKFNSGVNQYGLKPVTAYDFKNPTCLVNFGKATTRENLNTRRSDSGFGSSITLDGASMQQVVPKYLGISGGSNMNFCRAETAALRICMAKGTSDCERENATLVSCLGRVAPLRKELGRVGFRFLEWYKAHVSDHGMKPFTHRRHDWQHHYMQEELVNRSRQFGHGKSRRPKTLPWGAAVHTPPGFARRSRLPVNG